jgi:very-short-patch-repair endonuclease
MAFKKGNVPYNKNRPLTDSHRENLRLAHLGLAPWNKNLKGVQTHDEKFKEARREDALKHGLGKVNHTVWNKAKPGLQKWSKSQREKWLTWSKTPEAKLMFIKNGVNSMMSMKKKDTKCELALGKIIESIGLPVIKQKNFNNFARPDFINEELKLILNSDGVHWHTTPRRLKTDKRQNIYFKKHGYVILRFWDYEIFNSPDEVKKKIVDTVETIRGTLKK